MTGEPFKPEWHQDHGTYFTHHIEGMPMVCVSCRKPLEYKKYEDGSAGGCIHQCPVSHEASSQGAHALEHREEREKSFGERLGQGFSMLSDDYEDDPMNPLT